MKTFKNIITILILTFISMDVTAQKATKKQEEKKTGCISGNCENGKGKYVYSNSKYSLRYYEGNFVNGLKDGHGLYYDDYNGTIQKKYVGDFKKDEYHGKGKLISLPGEYEGEFYKGLKHGKGKYKSIVGWIFEGDFKFDEKYYGTFKFKDNSKYIGQYVDDKRNGQGKYYDKNGQLKFEGRFRNSKPIKNVTKGKKTYEIGIYEGEFVNNLADGYGVFTMKDGSVYKGTFKEDKAHGFGVMTAPNGMKYDGQFKDDKFNGYGTLTNPDGSKKFGEWKDNKLSTLIEEYDKNGKLKEKKKSNSMFDTKWD